jgi:hypothetical protein
LLQITFYQDAGQEQADKKSPDVETPGLWYLDLISVVVEAVKILIQPKYKSFFC